VSAISSRHTQRGASSPSRCPAQLRSPAQSAANQDKAAVDGDKAEVDGDKAEVDGDKAAVDGDKAAVDGDKAAVDGDKAAVNAGRAAVDEDKAAVDEDKAAVDEDKAAVNGGRAAKKADPYAGCTGTQMRLADDRPLASMMVAASSPGEKGLLMRRCLHQRHVARRGDSDRPGVVWTSSHPLCWPESII